MHILLDKLSATLIASTIFLMIFAMNLRNAETLTETTSFYGVVRHSEAFAKILRRDLQGIQEVINVTNEGSTQFRFVTRIGEDTTKQTVTYKQVLAAEKDGVAYYTIERIIDDVVQGGSKDIITQWEIRALNKDGQPVDEPEDATQVYVRFEAKPLYVKSDGQEGAQAIENIVWESRFFPPLRN